MKEKNIFCTVEQFSMPSTFGCVLETESFSNVEGKRPKIFRNITPLELNSLMVTLVIIGVWIKD